MICRKCYVCYLVGLGIHLSKLQLTGYTGSSPTSCHQLP
jgi:hypothetical protein